MLPAPAGGAWGGECERRRLVPTRVQIGNGFLSSPSSGNGNLFARNKSRYCSKAFFREIDRWEHPAPITCRAGGLVVAGDMRSRAAAAAGPDALRGRWQ